MTSINNCFKASVHHNSTFSGVYSNFNSFISKQYKVGLIFTSLFGTFSNVSDLSKKNPFPVQLIDSCIKNFLNKRFNEKAVTLTAEKKDLVIVLLFLGNVSFDLRTLLKNNISETLSFRKTRVSRLRGKKSKSEKSTTVNDQMLFCDQIVCIEDFKLFAASDSDFQVKVKERLLISRDALILNKDEMSLALYLFD